MPSMRTIFRAVVMIAVGAAIVKGWQLYGPPAEKVKAAATQVIEFVQSKIQSQTAAKGGPDPRLAAPSVNGASPTPPAVTLTPPTALTSAPMPAAEAPKLLASAGAQSAPAMNTLAPPSGKNDRMPDLMGRLQKLGAADTNLAPWGSGGNLYRFTCRAPLASAPAMTQHFESVAAEPEVAVEQVLAKVEAWQVAQRDGGRLRY